ncbi:MAG TPA: porin family protein [Candidatus Kapabacteria bacterium]|nr:porin family protein [Candidatus Kapabacteria bacterium]
MKKLCFLLVFILLPASTYANFDLGVKLGYTATKFSTQDTAISSGFKNGFEFGAFARFGKVIFIQPELMYSIDGGKLDFTEHNNTNTYEVKQKSVDIAVLLGWKFMNGEAFAASLQAGVFGSFLTDKGVEDALNDAYQLEFKDMIYGVKFGVGAEVGNFTVDLRYIKGLNDIYKSGEGFQSFDLSKSKIEFTVGLKLLSF